MEVEEYLRCGLLRSLSCSMLELAEFECRVNGMKPTLLVSSLLRFHLRPTSDTDSDDQHDAALTLQFTLKTRAMALQ